MPNIRISYEKRRGCGYRKPGGLYIIGEGRAFPCGLLPIILDVCPCCGVGIKPTRGWTWLDISKFVERNPDGSPSNCASSSKCGMCPGNLASQAGSKIGLLWIGKEYYKSPEAFNKEAALMGISRRISAVPNNFKVGETWVALAHREVHVSTATAQPAIFSMFLPTKIEYVVRPKDTEEFLNGLEARGISLVDVRHVESSSVIPANRALPQ